MAVEAKALPLNEIPAAPYLADIVVASLLEKHSDARALALSVLDDAGKIYKDARSQSDRLGAINLFISAMWEVFRREAPPDAEHLWIQIVLAFEELSNGRYPKALLPASGSKKPPRLDLSEWMLRAVLVVGKETLIEAGEKNPCFRLNRWLEKYKVCKPKLQGESENFEGILTDFTAKSREGNKNRKSADIYYAYLKEHMRLVRYERGYSEKDMKKYFEKEILAKNPILRREPKNKSKGTG
jgi:hypothetical protein